MKSLILSIALLGASFSVVAGCATESSSCTPGAQLACTCTNGASGSQVCMASGGFTACMCAGPGDGGANDGGAEDAGTSSMDAGASDGGGSVIVGLDGTVPSDALRFRDAVTGTDASFDICVTGTECNDADPCTTDSCVLGHCSNTPISCDDSNTCTVDHCDVEHAGCYYTPWCDDGISCTSDVCNHTGELTFCDHNPVSTACNDGISCTTDICSPTLDCIHLDSC
ncbi:MAG: hypothetical protein IPK60_11585 [Sandaracinaceae bacterium]|nr:hypothetical protein [Sandaracinaceae bacterium]